MSEELHKWTGTHDAPSVPSEMKWVRDREWDDTHLTFEDEQGVRYRVHKSEWRYVCPRPKDVPPQPDVLWSAIFEHPHGQWFRANDGLWYRANTNFENETGMMWADLWAMAGTVHWRRLCPVDEGAIPIMVPLDGPQASMVIPDRDPETGDVSLGKGHAAFINDDDKLVIRNIGTNVDVVLSLGNAYAVLGMVIRTVMRDQLKERFGDDNTNTGVAVITAPED